MVDGSGRAGDFHWGYALGGLCFTVLAVFRLEDGSNLWAAVFGLAALVNAYLSVRFVLPPSLGGVRSQEAAPSGLASATSEPPPEEMRQALELNVSEDLALSALGLRLAALAGSPG